MNVLTKVETTTLIQLHTSVTTTVATVTHYNEHGIINMVSLTWHK